MDNEKELNFSVKPLIESFDLEEFLCNQGTKERHSAIMIITGQQLVLSYTQNNGSGGFNETFANALREITDSKDFEYQREHFYMAKKVSQNFISAELAHHASVERYIAFYLQDLKSISPEEFNIFEAFYNKYNDTFTYYSRRQERPLVYLIMRVRDGEKHVVCSNLDPLYTHLKSIVSSKKTVLEDKKIIGTTIDKIR